MLIDQVLVEYVYWSCGYVWNVQNIKAFGKPIDYNIIALCPCRTIMLMEIKKGKKSF